VRQRFSDDPLTDCPECSGGVRRVINTVGVVFKGSGFYVTDSRNGKKSSLVNGSSQSNPEEKSEKSEKKSEEKDSSSSAASPTAATTETKSTAKSSEAPA
jgi:predicted nucleic acid-binding Zn ribbon protein